MAVRSIGTADGVVAMSAIVCNIGKGENVAEVFAFVKGQVKLGAWHFGVGDTVFLDDTAPLDLGEDDAVLEITIRHLDQSKAIKFSIAER